MTDYPRYPYDLPDHYDAPDRCDSTLEPPFRKRTRHGKMTLAAEVVIWSCAVLIVSGFLGAIAALITGVME